MKSVVVILSLFVMGKTFPQDDKYASERNSMVRTQIISRGISDRSIVESMKKVPRHLFVPPEYVKDAYSDFPVPIGYGQTISQPYVVAFMTESVRPTKKKKALEIGTGSGYQAAVLAGIVDSVYTMEIVPGLARESAARLKKLGYNNVIVREGDGYNGWVEHAPYDIIIVTAAPEKVPGPLIEQLAENGRLIIPVGSQSGVQELKLLIKRNGKIQTSTLLPVKFVPFRRR